MVASPLVPLHPTGTRTPLYCVHPASGTAYWYSSLAGLLGGDQPVYGLEAPGFDDGQTPLTRLTQLSSRYLGAVEELRPGRPACLLGWSMGGAVAFDMAQRRCAAGGEVPLLVVVDAPVVEPEPMPAPRLTLRRFAVDLAGIAPAGDSPLDAVLAGIDDQDPPEVGFAALADAGLIPAELDVEMLLQRYAVFLANVRALAGHRTEGGYPGPVVAVRASRSPGERMQWQRVAGNVREYVIPGDHYSIWESTGLAELAEIVRYHLDRVRVGAEQP